MHGLDLELIPIRATCLTFVLLRTLKFTSENEAPTLNLTADLPSLRFHFDEDKVTNHVPADTLQLNVAWITCLGDYYKRDTNFEAIETHSSLCD